MKLKSVLQDDLSKCIATGSDEVAIHHVFPGKNRKKSEKYGFLVALRPDYHTGKYGVHKVPNEGLDLQLKMKAQTYFEEHIGTREEFISEFGRSYL